MFNRLKRLFKKIFLNECFWLTLIIIGAFIVRLYKIGNPIADWHSWRQADTASVTRSFIERGINFLYPSYQDISSIQTGIFNPKGYRFVELPIFNLGHFLLAKYIPQISFDEAGRLTSIFASLVSTYLLYLLGKKFFGIWGGILAGFFYAFLPYNIFFTRIILPEPVLVTFGLAAIYFFVKYIDNKSLIFFFLSAVFLAVSILIKPFAAFYGLPLIYLFFEKHGIVKTLRTGRLLILLLLYLNICLIPFFLWRAWINEYPSGIPFFEWAFNGDGIRFRPAFWRWIFGERLGRLILGIWGIVPFVFGLLLRKKTSGFIYTFLLGMFLYVSVIATANVRHDYYQIIIIPAIVLVLANGVVNFIELKEFNKIILGTVLVFSLAMMFGMSFYQVKEFYKINHPEIIEAGKDLDQIASKDALVIAPYNGDTAFLYQTKRWGWPAIDDSVEALIKKGADYYISVTPWDKDTQEIIKKYQTIKETPKYLIVDLHKLIQK